MNGKSESSSSPQDKSFSKLDWAKWFLDHGFVIIPLKREDKRPAIEWKEYADPKRKLTPEETQTFLKQIEEGHNYAVLGGHNNLVILDFEDYNLAEKWILTDELKKLCETTLCVKTVHGGLHVYLITDQVPEHKFNPAFTRDGKTIMDLQSTRSYVVGPASCINHANCESTKCPWKGQNITTCYEPLSNVENAKIAKFDLRGLLRELAKRGKPLGIEPSPNLAEWLREDKTKEEEEHADEEEFEKLKEEMKKFDRFKGKTVEAIREELCKSVKKEIEAVSGNAKTTLRLAHGILCEGKNYSDLGIDRSRGDWHLLIFLLTHGVTDVDVITKLLPSDSKFFAPKWDRYVEYTLRKAWERVKPLVTKLKNVENMKRTELKKVSSVVISELLMKRYVLRTFMQIAPNEERVVGIFRWNKRKGIFEPYEERLRKKAREVYEYYASLFLASTLKKDKVQILASAVDDSVVEEAIKEIRDKTLTELEEEPLRIAFPNCTLEWTIGQHGRYVPRFIPAEERTPKHYAFHYIPHRIRLEELEAIDAKVKEIGDITVEMVEDLARRVCPKSLEVFKQWVGNKWILLFELIGYTLFPSQLFKKAFMLLGPRNTGKTTFAVRLLRKLLGKENMVNISIKELFDPRNRFVLINLYHKLVNTVSETAEYALDDIDRFKVLTGGDAITADVKFKQPVTFMPYAKLIVATNKPPKITDKTDSAFWFRWIIIEFTNQFAVDDTWFEKTFTEEELEGILTTAILAFSRVLLHGHFDFEQTEEELKGIWLSAIDSVYSFIMDYVREGKLVLDSRNGDLTVRTKLLYKIYMDYCKDRGYNGVGLKAFVRRLREYFGVVVQKKTVEVNGEKKRVRAFVGIGIADNSILPDTGKHYKDVSELDEFLDYIKRNNGVTKEFSEIVQDFGGDKEKANRLVAFCLKKNMCTEVGVDVVKFDL